MRLLPLLIVAALLSACATKEKEDWYQVEPSWSNASKQAVFEYCDESTPLPDLNQMVWGADQQAMFDACMRKHGYARVNP